MGQRVSAEPSRLALEIDPVSRYKRGNVARVTVGAPVVIGLDVANAAPIRPGEPFGSSVKPSAVVSAPRVETEGNYR